MSTTNEFDSENPREEKSLQLPQIGDQTHVDSSAVDEIPEETTNPDEMTADPTLTFFKEKTEQMRSEIARTIVGQETLVELLLVALISDGHVLVEGVPGIAKTLTAKLLARTLETGFSRIQFTPDLMPADVIGTNVFNLKDSVFAFNKGPIFSNVVLIDEINRAPAKTQSALFEVMEEYQISVDGTTYKMDFPFFVVATQNPLEQEGTYKLPEAQLDRFLFRILIDYPEPDQELEILKKVHADPNMQDVSKIQPVWDEKTLLELRNRSREIHVSEDVLGYIARLIVETRNNPDLFLGASPRASISILKSAKTLAALRGRAFVTPDDIQYLLYPVLNHRLVLSPEREMEGVGLNEIIRQIINKVEVPR
jgi:MoxR-like ATPase